MKLKLSIPIFGIILASLFLNLWGINHDLPYCYDHDEANFVVTALGFGKGDLNPGFTHGSFLYIFLFLQYVIFYFIKLFYGSIKSSRDFLVYYINNPESFFLIGRISIALVASSSVYLVYLINKKLTNRSSAILAALFLSFSLIYVNLAHLIKEDHIYVFFLLFSFLCVIYAKKNNKLFYLAAFIVGIATSVKYLGILGMVFVLSGFFSDKKSIREIIKGSLFICFLGILGFFIGQPLVLFYMNDFLRNVFILKGHIFDTPIGDQAKEASWYLYMIYLKRSFGIYLLIAFALSSLNIFNKRRIKANILLLPYILLYFLFIASAAHAQSNYLMGILPFICIYTAIFISDFVSIITRERLIVLVTFIVGFLLIFVSLVDSLRYDFLLAKPDTRAVSKNWIEKNISEDSDILIESAFPWKIVHASPLLENRKCLQDELKKIQQRGGNGILWKARIEQLPGSKSPRYYLLKERYFNRDTLNKYNPDYVIVTSFHDHGFWVSKEDRRIFRQDLISRYLLIKTFGANPYVAWFPSFNTLMENPENLKSVNLIRPGKNIIMGPNIEIYKRK